ncbi:MarR family winged helix-turn-helix transcriptional regulator [Azospirillum griseum]|uniref:MarR family transcriptional regulator n=1 Tax=Azospirillum griseum TaxID=2496639 RepID=A0A431VG38_9PROT|nr:MarR family winged helix-turn-helix transcriptional regulator [Azospirillum griseum]RTR19130.1 MarR family transcriptional regulator [Azospirillum griseum]
MTGAIDRRLVYLLNVGHRRLQRWIQARTADSGVTAAQSGVLFHLARQDGALIGEVGQALDAAPSAMSGLADRMVESGLIERRPDRRDGRAWRLFLTPAGRRALVEAKNGLADINARLSAGFSEEEMQVVARWLSSLPGKFPSDQDR